MLKQHSWMSPETSGQLCERLTTMLKDMGLLGETRVGKAGTLEPRVCGILSKTNNLQPKRFAREWRRTGLASALIVHAYAGGSAQSE